LPKLLERTTADFSRNNYAKHGSLLFGDTSAALVAMRLAAIGSYLVADFAP
jgi:hypothetical protein